MSSGLPFRRWLPFWEEPNLFTPIPRDEAFALPSEESVRIALRTQQLIAYESGVADTIDPLAGSYAVEALTNEIEKKAMEYITKIDGMGGAVKAIESGFIQQEIADSAYQYQKEIESKKRIIVGVNQFQVEEEPLKDIFRIQPSGTLPERKTSTC